MRPVPTAEQISARFWSKVDKTDPDGHWLWTASLFPTGYGAFWVTREGAYVGKMEYAHRFAWEDQVGPIETGLSIDHLCRVRACVRIDHLEPVTLRVNALRGESPNAKNARKTHCKRGHEFTVENTRVRAGTGHRSCRTCARDYMRAYNARSGTSSP